MIPYLDIEDVICEAKACSAVMGAKYAHDFKYGEISDQTEWDYRRLNSFIKTLERNKPIIIYVKEVSPVKSADFYSLKKQNSFLSLADTEFVTRTRTEISPCLSDSEIRHIIEQIKLICSICNCKCNKTTGS